MSLCLVLALFLELLDLQPFSFLFGGFGFGLALLFLLGEALFLFDASLFFGDQASFLFFASAALFLLFLEESKSGTELLLLATGGSGFGCSSDRFGGDGGSGFGSLLLLGRLGRGSLLLCCGLPKLSAS